MSGGIHHNFFSVSELFEIKGTNMHVVLAFLIFSGLFAATFTEHESPESEINYAVASNDIIRMYENVSPDSVLKKKNLIKQAHDYSCGSAALATLLKYFLDEDVDEKKVIMGLFKYGDVEKVKKAKAFSLYDMKMLLKGLGYKAGGYKASIDDLKNSEYWPCIIPIELYGYNHFVVLKGIYKNHVFIADPYMGNNSYTMDTFSELWSNKVMFIVQPKDNYRSVALNIKEDDLRLIDQDVGKQLVLDYSFFQDPPLFQKINHVNSYGKLLFKH